MAREVKHKSVGDGLEQVEWEGVSVHEIDGVPLGDVIITSIPPSGMCRILNIYWDPDVQRAIVEYDDEPIP